MDLDVDPHTIPTHGLNDTGRLEYLIALEDPHILERGVEIGRKVLNSLKVQMEAHSTGETFARVWLKKIEACGKEYQPPRTIIGVVGSTGAGKSSLINAVLDVERLLPMSCLGACTACPIEISFNDSDNPAHLYRAEIEFISTDEWIQELRQLLGDIRNGQGNLSTECYDAESPSGIAYSKIKAVYHRITRSELLQSDPAQLANDSAVSGLLDHVRYLAAESSNALYHSLRYHMGSKGQEEQPRMETWPLIKVIRVYTKAPCLKTGAVFVDLPGLQDSNAARVAVAANYIKSCTALWAVAPMIRAIDDKTAQNILDSSLKREMKYDGTWSDLTFICSKTDDISFTEVEESLGISTENTLTRNRIKTLDANITSISGKILNLRNEWKAVVDRRDDLEAERAGLSKDREKKHLRTSASTSLNVEIESIDTERKKLFDEKGRLEDKIKLFEEEKQRDQKERDELKSQIRLACLRGRNKSAKEAIKRGFAAGIEQRDHYLAQEQNEEEYDPEEPIRDDSYYDQVSQALSVFCVSSRSFQKLRARMQEDDVGVMWSTIADTEIPGLQEHTEKLTEAQRVKSCQLFLNSVNVLLKSMQIWAQNDGRERKIIGGEKGNHHTLQQALAELKHVFYKAVDAYVKKMKAALRGDIFKLYDGAITFASAAAPKTVEVWIKPHPEGLHYFTLRAVCRHDGTFRSSRGSHNFNADLVDPLLNKILSGWDKAFRLSLPAALRRFEKTVTDELLSFHQKITEDFRGHVTGTDRIKMLQQQLNNRDTDFEAKLNEVSVMITSVQRRLHRGFEPIIQAAMQNAYDYCQDQIGKGSLNRMKIRMRMHVEQARHTMFKQARKEIKNELNGMCDRVRNLTLQKVDDLYASIEQDYRHVLMPDVTAPQALISLAERTLRHEMLPILENAYNPFGELLGLENLIQEGVDVDGDLDMLDA